MTDASAGFLPSPFGRRAAQSDDMPEHRYAQEALARNKREGLELAVKARIGALLATSVLLVYLNPQWNVIWYLFLSFCLILVGLLQRRVGRVGQSRAELGLLFLDLLILTVGLLAPNPLIDREIPTALIYRFEAFQFFYVFLAVGILTYSWRTIVLFGFWTLTLWMLGAVCVSLFGIIDPRLSELAIMMFPDYPDLVFLMDPNIVNWDLRVQQVVVFFIVAIILAITVRRYQDLVLNSAEMVRERTNLARYFSPTMVEELSTKDEPLGQIRSHDAAILFVDIAGFTAYADGRPPEEVIDTLRAFHARMESEVFAHGGTLDKYLGDGLMATFGTPLPQSDDAARAMACVIAMADRMDALNADRRIDGLEQIDARFGLHFGPVVLGDIGANRLEFAVLGDAVNVASRLEGLTRKLEVKGIISDEAVRAAGVHTGLRRAPDQVVRGVSDPLAVWVLD